MFTFWVQNRPGHFNEARAQNVQKGMIDPHPRKSKHRARETFEMKVFFLKIRMDPCCGDESSADTNSYIAAVHSSDGGATSDLTQ